ncbi:flagellar biosynthesis protein FlhF [Pseudothauera nasutitermitis]|uniref:Flagellar biosynthesis protein FlhF n=1 Tax=Pseudothauera nasutitermitis TaxID=2565930 RepID=A0A4S4AZV5_9RHOO|nr:flagellar biosynthesis protein FlhF [Pseudothauera nasutitermitis]THF65738.1 flagellar biosynthesis protein FlhF [Pseudothauera nasutitermitis]
MNVKRYFARTAREALRELKEELGADAIVLSNRAVEGGVEILALPSDAVGSLPSTRPARAPAPAAAPVAPRVEDADDDYRVSLRAAPARQSAPVMRPFSPPRVEQADYPPPRSRASVAADPWAEALAAARAAAPEPDRPAPLRESEAPRRASAVNEQRDSREQDARVRELQEANGKLMAELSGIRGMIERQLAGFAWGEARRHAPARADLVGELLEAGFSAQLARRLVEAIAEDASPDAARGAVKNALNRELRALSSDADLIDRGGVYALVGPTGVGKTTTTAKLAARCVVRHGADKLALITTDGYRIGAQEQLRIYGRILGVPVFSVRDAADLRQTLAELRNKHMVLIDTVGVSQRDRMVAEQAAMLLGAGNVRRLLLLNATCRGDTLDDVVRAYKGPGLAGCILTKVDEAASLAPAIDVAVRRELELFYVANGQRVPEDLHLPNRAYLLHRAMREQAEGSPWKLQGDEAGLMLAAGGLGA